MKYSGQQPSNGKHVVVHSLKFPVPKTRPKYDPKSGGQHGVTHGAQGGDLSRSRGRALVELALLTPKGRGSGPQLLMPTLRAVSLPPEITWARLRKVFAGELSLHWLHLAVMATPSGQAKIAALV